MAASCWVSSKYRATWTNRAVFGVVRKHGGDLRTSDAGVLVFAQNVLNPDRGANESSAALSDRAAQDRRDHLGGVAGALREFADLVERLVRIGGAQVPRGLLEPAPGQFRQGRHGRATGDPGLVIQGRVLDGSLEGRQEIAIAVALQGVAQGLRGPVVPGCQLVKERRDRLPVGVIPLGERISEPFREHVHIAHVAEQAGQPLQLALDRLDPVWFHQVMKSAKLAAQSAGRRAEAMDALAVTLPGLGFDRLDSR